MNISGVVYVIIILIVVYFLFSWFAATSTNLSSRTSTDVTTTVAAKKVYTSSNSYSYSIWFNITNWTNNFGREKIIFLKTNQSTPGDTGGDYELQGKGDTTIDQPKDVLAVSLAPYENNLNILVPYAGNSGVIEEWKTTVYGIPIQKWVNISISFEQKVIDIYMDGKLVKTSVVPNIPIPTPDASSYKLIICPQDKTFKGEIAKFKFHKSSLNPQEAWEIYKKGFGSGMLSGLVNRYKLKIAFLKDDQEFNSFML